MRLTKQSPKLRNEFKVPLCMFFHLDVGWTFIHNYGGIVDFEKRGGKNVSVVFERG